MKVVSFSLEQGNKYFGKIDDMRFFIGTRTHYDGGKGLMNLVGTANQKYQRESYRPSEGFWADFIHPTAVAEGALFHTLNTYDRAQFTFSFLQFAAHVPNGDFVAYLRALIALPLAQEYFSDLILEDGRVCRITDDGSMPLESDDSTAPLLDYLNPSLAEIEDTEVIQSAKFVHWVQNDQLHRDLQVKVGVNYFKRKMVQYARQYGLDGADDTICLVIADIRHQGRAKSAAILGALSSADPMGNLLKIGEPSYHGRLVTLRREISKLINDGTFGRRKYSLAAQEFVPK